MKKNETQNISGIKINDSITMSVKKRRKNLRTLESFVIAVCGYISIIVIFLKSFELSFNPTTFSMYAIIFAVVYSICASFGQKPVWIFPISAIPMAIVILKKLESLKIGFKLVFNTMYKEFTNSSINYFKGVNPLHTEDNITLFLVIVVWILSFIIFFFTIKKPNVLIIVAVTFPILEFCLYHGIEVPPLWSALLLAYWLSLLSVCSSDLGEYYGGGGGFTRKDNLFFPKRRMKFKVTEKCGIMIIAITMIASLATVAVMKFSGYERTDKIKQQRVKLKTAINSFSMEDVATSISNITESLGLTFEYQDNHLGRLNKISYDGKTELVITVSDVPNTAIYLKGFNACEYKDNEWLELDDEKYFEVNQMFEKYGVYPQEFMYNMQSVLHSQDEQLKLKVTSKKKKRKFYTPYGIIENENVTFVDDNIAKLENSKSYSVSFVNPDFNNIFPYYQEIYPQNHYFMNMDFSKEQINNIIKFGDEFDRNTITDYGAYEYITYDTFMYYSLNPDIEYNAVMTSLVENEYREFVYENYLGYPDTDAMKEVYNEYSDIFDSANISSATGRLEVMQKLKDKMNSNVVYSLEPGKTPSTRDFVNYFLLENHKGYCVHYATSGVILARMAGIPSRYATGYISVLDDFNDDNKNADGSYTISLSDNRSHAWTEIYIDGYGWIPFEFTAGYSDTSVITEPTETTSTQTSTETTSTVTVTSKAQSNSSQEHKSTSTVTAISTAVITSAVNNTKIVDGTGANVIPKRVAEDNQIIKGIFITIGIIMLIILRRVIIVKLRQRKLSISNASECVMNNYIYVCRLLKYLGINQKNTQYNDFAKHIEDTLSGKFFRSGDFYKFNDIVMKTSFSNNTPDNTQTAFVSEFSRLFASKIYSEANILKKVYIKIILVII